MTYATSVGELLLGASPCDLRRAELGAPLAPLKDALAKTAKSIPWSHALDTAGAKVREALEVPWGDLLLSSWVRSVMLARYLDASRYPPDQTVMAHLAEHVVKIRLNPSVEVLVNDQVVGRIPIDASLSLTIKAGILVIKGGRILEFRCGTCAAKASLTVAGVPVAELKGDPVELPRVMTFADANWIGSV